jgi:hypothetical protein
MAQQPPAINSTTKSTLDQAVEFVNDYQGFVAQPVAPGGAM